MIREIKTNLKQIILGTPKEDSEKVKVLKSIRIKPIDSELTDAFPGDTFEVSKNDALTLAGAGSVDIIPSSKQVADKKEREADLKNLIPACPEPEPLPDSYKELPQPFADAWTLREKRRCLARHADLIAERLRQEWVGEDADEKLLQLNKVLGWRERGPVLQKLLGLRVEILKNDPRRFERIQKISDALYKAWNEIAEWEERKHELRWQKKVALSDEVIAQHGRASKAAKALEQTGFELHQIRIAALGLMEFEERRLYSRSQLGARCMKPVGGLSNVRLLWVEPDGNHRVYLDKPLESCVGMFRDYSKRADELEAELKAVEKELTAAHKAAA